MCIRDRSETTFGVPVQPQRAERLLIQFSLTQSEHRDHYRDWLALQINFRRWLNAAEMDNRVTRITFADDVTTYGTYVSRPVLFAQVFQLCAEPCLPRLVPHWRCEVTMDRVFEVVSTLFQIHVSPNRACPSSRRIECLTLVAHAYDINALMGGPIPSIGLLLDCMIILSRDRVIV